MLAQGKKIILRHLNPDDFEHFFVYRSDPELLAYQDFILKDRSETKSFIESQSNASLGVPGEWFQVAIALKANNRLIGDLGVQFEKDEPRKVEIGYTLNREYHGNGYATEAVQLMCDLLFKEYNVHKINAVVDIRNKASINLVQRLNFKQEAHFVNNYWDEKLQLWFDEYQFALINPED